MVKSCFGKLEIGCVVKIDELVYSVVVMVCLTWAVYTVAANYAPKAPDKPQVEQQELIEITRVGTNE